MSHNQTNSTAKFSQLDHHYMSLAISLAKQGHFTTSPNPRVGCVLVNDNKIIGQGFHQKAGQGHAEVNALADAKQHNPSLIAGATAYVTLEPCSHFGRTPPCAQALIDADIKRVVSAMVDPNPKVSGRGLAMLEAGGVNTQSGLLEEDAKALNTGFIKRMKTGMPYLRCKLAASLDGKTAMASGESKWITSAQARQDVQKLRAQSCAIITGADSVLIDNAKMTVRWHDLGELKASYPSEALRQPLRVVIDSQNRLTPDLAFFNQASPILIVRSLDETSLENSANWPHFVEQVQIKTTLKQGKPAKIDLGELLKYLAKCGMNDVLLESGAQLSGAFVEKNLVDELILYQAPKLMGADGKSLVEMPGIDKLAQAKSLAIADIRMLGDDIRITAKFKS